MKPASRAAGSTKPKERPATKDRPRGFDKETPPLYSIELRAATTVSLYDGLTRLGTVLEVGRVHFAYGARDEALGTFPDRWAALAAIRNERDGGGR